MNLHDFVLGAEKEINTYTSEEPSQPSSQVNYNEDGYVSKAECNYK